METSKTKLPSSETKGIDYFRRAMRSSSVATFRKRIRQAENQYSVASNYYRSKKQRAVELRCRAWILYLRFFLATKAATKKRLLDESWRLTKLALNFFRKDTNDIEFANTYDQLATTVALGYDFHWDAKTRLRKLQEGLKFGREAIAHLSPDDHKQLVTRICVRLALFLDGLGDYSFGREVGKLDQEALQYWRTAEKLDRQTALLQVGYPPPGFYRLLSDQEGAQVCNDALQLARETVDNFAIGWQLDQAAVRGFFEMFRHLDDAEKADILQKALKLSEEAQYHHSLVSFVTPNCGVLWPGYPYVEYFKQLSWYQKEPAKRRALLKKSITGIPSLFKAARSSGYPVANAYSERMASVSLRELSEWTTNPTEKRRLLLDALRHAIRGSRIVMKTKPEELGPVSVVLRNLAQIRVGLADLEPNSRRRVKLLRDALKDSEKGLLLYSKYLGNVAKGQPHILHRVGGRYQLEHGDMLTRLYNVTKDQTLLSKIGRTYSDAANTLKQAGATKDLGVAYWKAAEALDLQQASLAAAENFGLAAKAYQSINDKDSMIVSIFQDYAKYMEAWSDIEQARAAHRRFANEEAKSFYEKAAALHRSTEQWSVFAPYYEALGKLESAENLSRVGDPSAAIRAFDEAIDGFRASIALFQRNVPSFHEPQEKATIERLAASFNEVYCRARRLIEEARIAEDKGDHHTSAELFGEAADILENVARAIDSQREKNELLYIGTLAKAWEEMSRSHDKRDSIEGLRKALRLFDESLDYSSDANTKNVSLGHKYFCEGLAASEAFSNTLSSQDYESAVKYYGTASDYFAKAGFNIQSTHVQGCKLLLDANAAVAKSNKDSDPTSSATSYGIANEILQEAADAFAKSHQTAKQSEVLGLLDSINKQHGISTRLASAAKTVSRISPIVAFPTPAGGEELPVGHSRLTGFQIDVDCRVSALAEAQKVGELSMELRVANIGTEPIQIIRIENVVPDTAHLLKTPPNAKVDNGSIIPVPKNTPPMNVETFQFGLDPGKDPVVVRPNVVFADERGRERFHQLPPKVIVSSPILDYLSREYAIDYREKQLASEHCGWRTLTSIGKALKLPRSHFYGERRWGHTYARPLETLIRSGVVECRTFPGERGRGGRIVKARLAYETDVGRSYLATKEPTARLTIT